MTTKYDIYIYFEACDANTMHCPWGRGYSTKFYTGRLCPEVQPQVTLRNTIIDRKGAPFIYLLLTKYGTVPFTYLV